MMHILYARNFESELFFLHKRAFSTYFRAGNWKIEAYFLDAPDSKSTVEFEVKEYGEDC